MLKINATREQFRKLVKDNIELTYDSGQYANLLEDLLKNIVKFIVYYN